MVCWLCSSTYYSSPLNPILSFFCTDMQLPHVIILALKAFNSSIKYKNSQIGTLTIKNYIMVNKAILIEACIPSIYWRANFELKMLDSHYSFRRPAQSNVVIYLYHWSHTHFQALQATAESTENITLWTLGSPVCKTWSGEHNTWCILGMTEQTDWRWS